MAGSGTTSAILKMAVVFVATHPSALKRLVQEIDEAEEAGLLSPVLQFKVAADQLVSIYGTADQAEGNKELPIHDRHTKRNATPVRQVRCTIQKLD